MTATVRGISTEGRSGSENRTNGAEYSVTYLVYTDDRNDGPMIASDAFGIPRIGDVYQPGNDFDPKAMVVDKKATQRDSPFEWEVEVVYSTELDADPKDGNDGNTSPLDEPADISYGFQARTLAVPGYFNDPANPNALQNLEATLVNSYGEPFDPAPEMDVHDLVVNVVKNMPNLNVQWMMWVANTVNSVPFNGAESRQLRLVPPEATRKYDATIGLYWAVAFQFIYRYETWDLQRVNEGLHYLTDAGAFGILHLPFQDDKGYPRVGLLTTAGYALNASSTLYLGRYYAGGEAPTFSRFRIYREIDFNTLGIL